MIRWTGHSTSIGGVNYTHWLPTNLPMKVGEHIGPASARIFEDERGNVSVVVSMPVSGRREGLRILRDLTDMPGEMRYLAQGDVVDGQTLHHFDEDVNGYCRECGMSKGAQVGAALSIHPEARLED